jgi:DNA-binding NarL/FixJ family response regulator
MSCWEDTVTDAIVALHPRHSRTTRPQAEVEPTARLLLAEPHELTRMGMHRMLEWAAPEAGVTSVATWWAAAELVAHHPPTVLLASTDLEGAPDQDLVDAVEGVGTVVVLLVRGTTDRTRLRVFLPLPITAVLRDEDLSVATFTELLAGLDRARLAMPSHTARHLLALAAEPAAGPKSGPNLTARELTTLGGLAQGLTNREIARRMCITEHGVKRHVANLLAKLHAANRTAAVTTALQLGLIRKPPESADPLCR